MVCDTGCVRFSSRADNTHSALSGVRPAHPTPAAGTPPPPRVHTSFPLRGGVSWVHPRITQGSRNWTNSHAKIDTKKTHDVRPGKIHKTPVTFYKSRHHTERNNATEYSEYTSGSTGAKNEQAFGPMVRRRRQNFLFRDMATFDK